MDWQEEYKRKLVTAEEAVKVVKSGDRVGLPVGGEAKLLLSALARRKDELENVEIAVSGPRTDFGWFQPGWEKAFKTNVDGVNYAARKALDERRADYSPIIFTFRFKPHDEMRPDRKEIDVTAVVVSPPDKNGFCSFGHTLSDKRSYCKRAKKVLAEVNANLIRTYGENYIHVSEIYRFVENTVPLKELWPSEAREPDEHAKDIAGYVSTLIKDRDTIELGVGSVASPLPNLGILDGKRDLGLHAGAARGDVIKLIKAGVINGKYKTLHPGKAVASTVLIEDESDLAFIENNPLFELYDMQYTNDIRVIAANDNMVALNQAVAVDLTGQVTADTIGTRIFGGGALADWGMGALLSKGGRNIIVLPSTVGGKASRITPMFEAGTVVSIPRTFADYIVTEYGIASLLGKSQRERALELISVAHPDFRAELKRQAEKLYWP